MTIPIIILVAIPIFLGIVYISPFDQYVEEEPRETSKPDTSILYYILIGFWALYLIKILLRMKKGTFKVAQRH